LKQSITADKVPYLDNGRLMQAAVIRPYENRDEPQVVELVRELQNHESAFYDRMLPPMEIGSWYVWRALRDARGSGGEFLVAEQERRIIGYATLLVGQSSRAFLDEILYTYAYVGDLIVTKDARRQGAGVALLAECERRARGAGEKWLRIGAIAANSDAARIYERYGFAVQFLRMEKPLI
jgi:GNAT superfamily N-acetyltransferase